MGQQRRVKPTNRSVIVHCKNSDITIVFGDFNAKVGDKRDEYVTGGYGHGERNARQYLETIKLDEEIN